MNRFLKVPAAAATALTMLIAGAAGFPQAPGSGAAPVVQAPDQDKAAPAPLDPTEAIAKITVQIDIGAGDDLQEPVALDLGLGFPLWLQPVGRKAGDPPPSGAIPQETTAKDKLAAGESALFTFTVNGDPGQDQFRTSGQLLANTTVADIARVGFSSAGTTNWVLAGYDIMINDKPFSSGKPNVNLGDRESGKKRMAELAVQMGPLEQVRDDMTQLLLANQLEENDKAQLHDVLAKLSPLNREKTWLEGQLAGKYPWYQDTQFKAAADGKPPVGSAKVTLLTFPDKSADTANYVYARIGGRKYFISSPDQPLTGQEGPQIFDLDLLAGPLTDGDLRDWALGMLAEAKPYDSAPDRWHGQRAQFEIDGQVRYNSDDTPADRLSLQAVRLIPPAHLDKTGNLVTEEETDRLVYLWDPTKGSGLDPATKSPLPAPPPDGPDAPPPENPGAPPDGPDAPPPDNADPAQPDAVPDLPEPPPPGVPEDQAPPDALGGEVQPLSGDGSDPSQQGFGPPCPLTDPSQLNPGLGGILPGSGFDPLILNMLNQLLSSLSIPISIPVPSGNPPQVSNVRFTSGFLVDGPFTVQWDVTGDESQVAFYQVNVQAIQPDQPVIFGTQWSMGTVGSGQRLIPAAPVNLAADSLASGAPRFLQAQVTAVTTSGSFQPNPEVSAARMVYPAGTILSGQPSVRPNFKLVGASAPTPPFLPIQLADPASSVSSVWTSGNPTTGEFVSQGTRFEAAAQGLHLFMRANLGDKLGVRLNCPNPGVANRLVADLGFRDTGTGSVSATITGLEWFADPGETVSLGSLPLPTTNQTTTTDASNGQTTSPFIVTADPTLMPGLISTDHMAITIEFSFTGTITGPPALFGVRLIP